MGSGNGYRGRAPLSPRFQQRHYEVIADTLNRARQELMVTAEPVALFTWQCMVDRFGAEFVADNEHFKWDVFQQACGYPKEDDQ